MSVHVFDRLQCQSNKFFKMWQVTIFWNDINKFKLRKCREYERIKFVEHLATIPTRNFLSFRLQGNNSKIKVYGFIIFLVLCTRKNVSLFLLRKEHILLLVQNRVRCWSVYGVNNKPEQPWKNCIMRNFMI